jgi:hypothetical protein
MIMAFNATFNNISEKKIKFSFELDNISNSDFNMLMHFM